MNKKYSAMALLLMGGLMLPLGMEAGVRVDGPENSVTKTNEMITGVVTNAQGERLIGVVVRNAANGDNCTTDADGRFAISGHPGETLEFSYIGYKQQHQQADKSMRIVMIDDNQMLNEVIVTTQKKRQSAIEVPAAVSAVTGEGLGKLNLYQMDDMAMMVHGLQIQIQSPNNPGYVIRGVTDDDGASYSQPRVSVFLDGVSTSRSRASVTELYDLERVEVAKGPQGTLFGRGAEIGGISIIRNKAKNQLSGELSLRYGAYNTRQATGFINTPIVKDKLANRFAFDYDARDGFIKNLAGGRLNGKSALAFRNSTALWIDEATSLNLILDYQHDSYPGTSFHTGYAQFGNPDLNSPANLEEGKGLFIHRNVGGATLLVDHDFSNSWRLSSITGFRAFNSDEKFDADGTYLPLLACEEKTDGTQFSQEFRMNYDNHQRFSGFGGISYFYENSSQNVIARTNMQYIYPVLIQNQLKSRFTSLLSQMEPLLNQYVPEAYRPLVKTQLDALMGKWFSSGELQPAELTPDFYGDINGLLSQLGMSLDQVLGGMGEQGATMLATLKGLSAQKLLDNYQEQGKNYGTNQALEVFADGSYKIWRNLNLTLGLRGTYEHQESGYSSTTVPSIFGAVLYNPTEGGRKVSTSKNYWSWVGRVALNYMVGRNNIYVSVSRGRRPGVIYYNNSPELLSTLKPEIIYSYEGGVKGSVFGGHVSYDFCAYYYDWYHFQTSCFDQSLSRYIADDAGRAHSLGVEASLAWSPVRQLTLFANYAYIDGRFNDKDEDGKAQEYAGHRFRLTPKNSFMVGTDVEIPLKEASCLYFRPTYSYKSKVYFEDSNETELTQKGFGLSNFSAGWTFKPNKVCYELGIFGKNIFDKKYIIDAGNSGRQIGFPTYVGGTRSVIGILAKIGF